MLSSLYLPTPLLHSPNQVRQPQPRGHLDIPSSPWLPWVRLNGSLIGQLLPISVKSLTMICWFPMTPRQAVLLFQASGLLKPDSISLLKRWFWQRYLKQDASSPAVMMLHLAKVLILQPPLLLSLGSYYCASVGKRCVWFIHLLSKFIKHQLGARGNFLEEWLLEPSLEEQVGISQAAVQRDRVLDKVHRQGTSSM